MNTLAKILLAFALLLCTTLNVSAAKAPANITMADGTEYRDVELKLPGGWDKTIQFTTGDKKMKVASDSVGNIVLWHKDAPENKVMLVWRKWGDFHPDKDPQYKLSDGKNRKWFSVESVGDHALYLISVISVSPGKKKISMQVTDAPHFFQRRDMDYAIFVPYNWRAGKKLRAWLCAFFPGDDVLAANITDNGYFNRKEGRRHGGTMVNPYLYEDIAVDYTPGRHE